MQVTDITVNWDPREEEFTLDYRPECEAVKELDEDDPLLTVVLFDTYEQARYWAKGVNWDAPHYDAESTYAEAYAVEGGLGAVLVQEWGDLDGHRVKYIDAREKKT